MTKLLADLISSLESGNIAINIDGLTNNNNNNIGDFANNNNQLLYWSQYTGAQYTVEQL